MKYGLPYKGSKNKLAERIVSLLPRKRNLVDLFCGGCAVSHAALVMGKYEHIHIYDLNWMCPTLFIDALQGKYNNDTRWISRDDFFRLRDTDPYVAVVWSFGNNQRDYLYSKDIEPLKKAIHYAIFFSDYSLGQALGHDLSFIDPITDVQRRYIAVKRYFSQFGHFQQQSLEGGGRCKSNTLLGQKDSTQFGGGQSLRMQSAEAAERCSFSRGIWGSKSSGLSDVPTEGNGHRSCNTWSAATECRQSKKKSASDLGKPNTGSEPTALHRLQYRERQHSLPTISGGQELPITSSVLDYADVEIPEDSVIYCDIPYEGTNVYNGAEHFDYERFYDWAEQQTEPVFISSYDMPRDRFDCIQEWSHRSTINDSKNIAVTERIFLPKHQTERGNITRQLLINL